MKEALAQGFSPIERGKIMEHETKREKKRDFRWEVVQGERQKVLVFSEVYELAHKFKRICDTYINAEKYHMLELGFH